MIEFKASTKQGQNIINRANYNEGVSLRDVYASYSAEKERAYNWCLEQYNNTELHNGFHICSHNTFQFSVAWFGVIDGETVLRVETSNNSFIVWLER